MEIIKQIQDSIDLKNKVLGDTVLLKALEQTILEMVRSFCNGGKVLFCGNGGSAADAQHLSAELAGRFYFDRGPLYSEALHVNSSFVTAVANDYSFEHVYQRMVRATGQAGDILVALSTSGNSSNIINALEAGKKQGMVTIGFTGKTGGRMGEFCDILLKVPSEDTPRIQEAHILLGHIICENVEREIFKPGKE